MSQARLFALALLSFLLGTAFGQASSQGSVGAAGNDQRVPVLVELFTSEGCSSCPAADALLARFEREQPVRSARIIVLEEHVDYWDQDGWHDRFSSHLYTERQTAYGFRLNVKSIYTPEMVVDGAVEFVGNDTVKALHSVGDATLAEKLGLTIERPIMDGRRISSSVMNEGALPAQSKGDLYAALVDVTDSTAVRSGENGGRQLQHVGVVRSLQRVGSVTQLASGPVAFRLDVPQGSEPGSMRLVVFAQHAGQRAVFGAAEIPIAP